MDNYIFSKSDVTLNTMDVKRDGGIKTIKNIVVFIGVVRQDKQSVNNTEQTKTVL